MRAFEGQTARGLGYSTVLFDGYPTLSCCSMNLERFSTAQVYITGKNHYNASTPMALRTFSTYVFATGFNLLITLLLAGPKNVSSNSLI